MDQIDSAAAIELVMRLLAVPGKSCQEALIAEAVIAELKQMGVPAAAISFDSAHKRTPAPGQVGNLIVKLPGDRKRPRIMLSAHMDTVPICVGCQPKRTGQVIRSADKATGLGGDDRAGVATVLTVARTALQSGQSLPPLTLCFFVQEEIGLQGSRQLTTSKLGKPSCAFNFDGGDPSKMTIGATGGERMKIRLYGQSAHAGLAPQAGASAIVAAGLAIAALNKQGWLGAVKKKPGQGTSNIGVIHGGSATNVVADYVELAAEARSHDGEFRTQIAGAIEQAFHAAAAQVKSSHGHTVRAEVERRVDYESFRLPRDSQPVQWIEQAITSCGKTPTHAISNGGVDANWLVKHGIPTVTIGCGQRDVHTNQESLDIPDFLLACQIGWNVIQHAA